MQAIKFLGRKRKEMYALMISKTRPICDTWILWFKCETCKVAHISRRICETSQNVLQSSKEGASQTFRDLKLCKLPLLL